MDKGYTLIVALLAGWAEGISCILLQLQLCGLYIRPMKFKFIEMAVIPGFFIGLTFYLTRNYINSFFIVTAVTLLVDITIETYVIHKYMGGIIRAMVITGITFFVYLIVDTIGELTFYFSICTNDVTATNVISTNAGRIGAVTFSIILPILLTFYILSCHNITLVKLFDKVFKKD